jgi:hypothetical protein
MKTNPVTFYQAMLVVVVLWILGGMTSNPEVFLFIAAGVSLGIICKWSGWKRLLGLALLGLSLAGAFFILMMQELERLLKLS